MGIADWIQNAFSGTSPVDPERPAAGEYPEGPENPAEPEHPDDSENRDDPEKSGTPSSPKAHVSPASSSASEFAIRKPGASTAAAAPPKEGSLTSSSSSEFPARNPGNSMAKPLPGQTQPHASPHSSSSSKKWPRTHATPPLPQGSFNPDHNEDEEDDFQDPYDQKNPPNPEDNEPLPYGPYNRYGAAARTNYHVNVPDPEWVRNESVLPRPSDYPTIPGMGRLRIRNTTPPYIHDPADDEQETTEYVDDFQINPLEGFVDVEDVGSKVGGGLQGFTADEPVSQSLMDWLITPPFGTFVDN